jgi:hypothetical protein
MKNLVQSASESIPNITRRGILGGMAAIAAPTTATAVASMPLPVEATEIAPTAQELIEQKAIRLFSEFRQLCIANGSVNENNRLAWRIPLDRGENMHIRFTESDFDKGTVVVMTF